MEKVKYIKLKEDFPYMISFSQLYNKTLKVLETNNIYTSQGIGWEYVIEFNKEKFTIPSKFVEIIK